MKATYDNLVHNGILVDFDNFDNEQKYQAAAEFLRYKEAYEWFYNLIMENDLEVHTPFNFITIAILDESDAFHLYETYKDRLKTFASEVDDFFIEWHLKETQAISYVSITLMIKK